MKDTEITSSSKVSPVPKKIFRSILPHEPLDFDNYDDKGYIHLQGAFEPKKRSKNDGGSLEASSPDPYYWMSSLPLQQALLSSLRDDYHRLKLPFPVDAIEILDSSPPYTKTRLQYATPQQALRIHVALRTLRISPCDLLDKQQQQQQQQQHHCDKYVATLQPVATFSTHPCQGTMITTKPLSREDSSSSSCWTRSNPPKFRRLLHDHNDQVERSKTRFVYVTGLISVAKQEIHDTHETANVDVWNEDLYITMDAMRKVFGHDVEIFITPKQTGMVESCHLGFPTPQEAQKLVETLQGQSVQWQHPSLPKLQSGPLFLDYVTITQKCKAKQQARESGGSDLERGESSRAECTSSTDHVRIPGLLVVEDYVSEGQEEALVAVLTGPVAPWAPEQRNKSRTGAVKRKVQHYGYVFDYQTADVLRDRTNSSSENNPANCPPLPAVENKNRDENGDDSDEAIMNALVQEGKGWNVLAYIIEKTRRYEFKIADEACETHMHSAEGQTNTMVFPDINQMTVNQYKPGEGIGSHVDTLSAFGDGLISISLNSSTVMEFRRVASENVKKLVYLPRRSLVLMSGPARYEWEHQIVTRRTDTHQGVVLQRGLRISLTLRTALSLDGTPMPPVESSNFPPKWDVNDGKLTKNAWATPDTERDHVHAVYDAIATQWHHTRGKRGVLWPGATQFLQNLPVGSIVADVGCGDGKYFPAIWEAGSFVIGTDISLPLLETAFQKDSSSSSDEKIADTRKVSPHRQALQSRPAVAVGDCMSVPLRTNSCDAAICIAVLHHLSTLDRRIRCIEELVRIVKPGGRINVQAWAMEQDEDSRRRFAATDVFVPFNAQPKYLDKATTRPASASPAPSFVPSKSVAELYSEAFTNADFDERKGLVVFQRYCHLYRAGEMEEIVRHVDGVRMVESGYESGNYFVILEVM